MNSSLKAQIFFVLILLATLLHSVVSPAAVKLVTSAVGQVGKEIVTSRRVQISAFLDRWLMLPNEKRAQLKSSEMDRWVLALESEEFKSVLSALMLELMVAEEYQSFDSSSGKVDMSSDGKTNGSLSKKNASKSGSTPAESPSKNNLKSESESSGLLSQSSIIALAKQDTEKVMKDLSASSQWKKLEVERAEVEKLMEVKALAKQFLKVKLESVDAQIPEAEIKSYYQRQKLKFGSLPYEEMKGMIQEKLTQEAQMDRLKDWFEVLKRKYRIQFFGNIEK